MSTRVLSSEETCLPEITHSASQLQGRERSQSQDCVWALVCLKEIAGVLPSRGTMFSLVLRVSKGKYAYGVNIVFRLPVACNQLSSIW